MTRLGTWLGEWLGTLRVQVTLCVVVSAAVLGIWGSASRHFVADDARMIERVRSGGPLSFNTREVAFPVTSHTWFALNSGLLLLVGARDPLPLLRVVSTLATVLACGVFVLVARRHLVGRVARVGTVLLLVTSPVLVKYSSAGMESTLVLLVSCLYLWWLGTRAEGLAAGLAVLARPEGVFLAAGGFVAACRDRRSLIAYVATGLLVAGAFTWAVVYLGPALFETIRVKSGGFRVVTTRIVPNVLQSALILAAALAFPLALVAWLGRAHLLEAVRDVMRLTPVRLGLWLLMALLVGYGLLLNRDMVKSRYFLVVLPFLYLGVGVLVDRLARAYACDVRMYVGACVFNLAYLGTVGVSDVQQSVLQDVAHQAVAERIASQARPGDVVVSHSIGWLGYRTGLDVLDLVGLASPSVVTARSGEQRMAVLRRYTPDFIIEAAPVGVSPPALRTIDVLGGRFIGQAVDHVDVELAVRRLGIMVGRAPYRYVVYRLVAQEGTAEAR